MNARIGHGHSHQELDELEMRLRGTLRPLVPPGDLLSRLQARVRMPSAGELKRRLRDWQTLWLALVGVISGALAIITLARALFHLTGRRGSG
ncbi:MAG TPA: hypothetical protein VFH29_02270 [Anaerolineales bacterium]|nr:hypothetical protein [Anaerolineales bacterium]